MTANELTEFHMAMIAEMKEGYETKMKAMGYIKVWIYEEHSSEEVWVLPQDLIGKTSDDLAMGEINYITNAYQ